MGQQQLLLIVLAVIIVGIAVVVGIGIFTASAASANLEAITSDLLNLANRAQQYYVKPIGMGGGGNSFVGLTNIRLLISKSSNGNGTYSVKTAGTAHKVVLKGVGRQDGDGNGTNCTVEVEVFPDSIATTIIDR